METFIVIIIVGLAAFFIGRRFYQNYIKKNQSCSCGCASCPTDASTCELPEAREHIQQRSEK
jgi:hypothetical protein